MVYPLLATRFSLQIWLVRRPGGRRYAPTSATLLTVLGIGYLRFKKVPSRFYAFGSAIFSYLDTFLVVFYLSFYFILAQDASARDSSGAFLGS